MLTHERYWCGRLSNTARRRCPDGKRWRVTPPRCDGLLGGIASRPGSTAQHQCAPTASGPGAVCGSRRATKTGTAGAAAPGSTLSPRPSVHMALAAGRAPHRHNAIPAAGDADLDHIRDAVEGAQRPLAQTAVAGPPPSGAGRTCQRRASRACARCRRSSRASSGPCSLNNTTNGPNHVAASASTSSANPATTNTHHQNRRPTRRH
jgi:hypothetical protein